MRGLCRATRLVLVSAALVAAVVNAAMPGVEEGDDAAIKAAIDAAASSVQRSAGGAPPAGAPTGGGAGARVRPRREPKDFFFRYSQEEAATYPEMSRRHLLVFSPPEKLDENEKLMLEAAEQILNPPAVDLGEAGGNAGGGKVVFLLVDMSDPANAPIMHRCSIPSKTSKSGVLRVAQFPSSRPLEIFKPVGKYKVSAKYLTSFMTEVRNSGPRVTRSLMSEVKVKDFASIDTSPTVLQAVGATANFLVRRPDDVVLFSYLPTCPHCQSFNETFLQVASECEAADCGVKFVLMDASRNEHNLLPESMLTTSFPQVHMFKAHEKARPIAFDDFANKARGLRHFVDSTRWFKDRAKLTRPGDDGFQLWDEEVDPMTAKHFNAYLSKVPTFVAMFYVDTSQQSKLAMPEFAKAGQRIGFDRMPMLKIDCAEKGEHDEPVNGKLCSLFKLTGYPTIMYVDTTGYNHGDDISQFGETLEFHRHNADDIYAWMREKVSTKSEDAARRISIGKARSEEL
eukprot:INCI15081.1.p1 GENE.INCI15081.1~~INCI15081.1.p1  ORF type:complete len:512 (-),score=91.15 INCI15081.1:97-1632(-)